MSIDPLPATFTFIAQVAHAYTSLIQSVPPGEDSLGGVFLYVGELDTDGRAILVAANIAGAASLAATADLSAQKQAIREGAADFLVTNLDEALRILKNEIRKREPVSVAVSLAPELILEEMFRRGVVPNLLPPPSNSAPPVFATFIAQGARSLAPSPESATKLLIWQIPADYSQRPAAFDQLLLQHLPSNDPLAKRWLRLAPRYLGPHTRRLRPLLCDEVTAIKLVHVLGTPLQP